jgi:hypothetical protein
MDEDTAWDVGIGGGDGTVIFLYDLAANADGFAERIGHCQCASAQCGITATERSVDGDSACECIGVSGCGVDSGAYAGGAWQ